MTRGCCHGPSDVQHGAACGESWRRGPVECGAIPAHADAATTTRRTWARTPSGDGRFVSMGQNPSAYVADRVVERRRAVALANHYREAEGLSIPQIAGRVGRSPATVKAYFYDPTDANKRPTDTPRGQREPPALGGAALWPIPPGARADDSALCARVPVATPREEILSPTDLFCAWAGRPARPVDFDSYARLCRGTAPRGATRPPLPRPGVSVDRGDRSSAGTRRGNHQGVSLRSDRR